MSEEEKKASRRQRLRLRFLLRQKKHGESNAQIVPVLQTDMKAQESYRSRKQSPRSRSPLVPENMLPRCYGCDCVVLGKTVQRRRSDEGPTPEYTCTNKKCAEFNKKKVGEGGVKWNHE